VELLDSISMAAINKYGSSGRKRPERDSLFFKIQGHSQAALQDTAGVVRKIAEKHDGTGFELAQNEKEAAILWDDRRNAYSAGLALMKEGRGRGFPTDVWWVWRMSHVC